MTTYTKFKAYGYERYYLRDLPLHHSQLPQPFDFRKRIRLRVSE